MKIKFEDLKLIYQDHIRSQVPASRSDCPSLKSIYNSLKGKRSRRYRSKLIDHISHCCFCLDDFEIVRSIILQENITLTNLYHIVSISQIGNHRLNEKKYIYKIEKHKLIFNFRHVTTFSLAILVAAFIIFGLLTNRRFIKETFFPDQNRSASQNEIILLYPINDVEYSISNFQFRWKSVPKSNYYIIDIFDESLLPVWKSSPVFEPFFKFHSPLPEFIKLKKKYFWMVTAIISNNKKLESEIGFFYLK
jgi:hypothetical protein